MTKEKLLEAWAEIVDWIIFAWNFLYDIFSNPDSVSALATAILALIATIALILTFIQIRLSHVHNRSARFAKATEILGNDNSSASHGGGLYMLRDLIRENPEKEYIRCAEVICYWLSEKSKDENVSNPEGSKYLSREVFEDLRLRRLALEIFTTEAVGNLSDKTRRNLIEEYKKEHGRNLWPDLADANLKNLDFPKLDLQSAFLPRAQFPPSSLRKANLQNALMVEVNMERTDLQGADFKGAIIAGAEMKTATGLEAEQIIEATWQWEDESGVIPELPEYLKSHPKVIKWLKKPNFRYELKP